MTNVTRALGALILTAAVLSSAGWHLVAAAGPTLSPEDIRAAISRGAKNAGREQGVVLIDVGRVIGSNLRTVRRLAGSTYARHAGALDWIPGDHLHAIPLGRPRGQSVTRADGLHRESIPIPCAPCSAWWPCPACLPMSGRISGPTSVLWSTWCCRTRRTGPSGSRRCGDRSSTTGSEAWPWSFRSTTSPLSASRVPSSASSSRGPTETARTLR